jgi:hypothetical protein
MTKVERNYFNKVITIKQRNTDKLDKYASELLNIIDKYGCRDVYPRFYAAGEEGFTYCTVTPKVPKENIEEFNKEISEWKNSYNYQVP